MANRYSRIFHHISTQDLKRNQKEELRLRKIEDNKVLIEEEKKEVIRKALRMTSFFSSSINTLLSSIFLKRSSSF